MTTIQTGINVVLDEQIGVQSPHRDTDNDVLLDPTLSDALTALGVAGISRYRPHDRLPAGGRQHRPP